MLTVQAEYVSIQTVTERLQITSRTLRHWESKGLITSERDPESGWRRYTQMMVTRIQLIALLRRFHIPLADIQRIVGDPTPSCTAAVLRRHLDVLAAEAAQLQLHIEGLHQLLRRVESATASFSTGPGAVNASAFSCRVPNDESLVHLLQTAVTSRDSKEECVMHSVQGKGSSFRIVTMYPMRSAAHEVFDSQPEEKALDPLWAWIEDNRLQGTARIFGYNTTPYKPGAMEYGWGTCISIPQGVEIPQPFQEKLLPGGTYAALDSSPEIYESWQALTKALQTHSQWQLDDQRPCLEEHIPSPDPDSTVGRFHLTLLAPVTAR